MAQTSSVNAKETMGMMAKRRILTFASTAFFAVLSFIIVFPLLAGLIASFRPGTELIRRGLSVDLDFSTMTLANYKYLFGNTPTAKDILCGTKTA